MAAERPFTSSALNNSACRFDCRAVTTSTNYDADAVLQVSGALRREGATAARSILVGGLTNSIAAWKLGRRPDPGRRELR